MNIEVKNVVAKLGKLEKNLRQKIESGVLVKEAKDFADAQSKLLRQKVKTNKDLKKVVQIVEQRRKQIEKVAKEFPRDVKEIRSYVDAQRKELKKAGTKLLAKLKEVQKANGSAKERTTKKKAASRKTTKKAAKRK